MKYTIKVFATTAITAVLLNLNAAAQSVASGPFENAKSLMLTRFNDKVGDEKKNTNTINNIHPRAMENFQKSFKQVTGEKWVKTGFGYAASFTDDVIQVRVDYDNKGRWLETIRYYHKKELPVEVSDMIKRGYSDYTIFGVTEVSFDDEPVYLVHIQNDNHIKIIGVYQEEMQEVESYKHW